MMATGLWGLPLVWLWHATWQASVLVGLVLLAQTLFRSKLPASWRYALWLLVLIRLVAPVVPESPASVFNLAKVTWPERPADLFRPGGKDMAWRRQRGLNLDALPLPAAGLSNASASEAGQSTGMSLGTGLEGGSVAVEWSRRFSNVTVLAGLFWVWFSGVVCFSLRLFVGHYCFAGRLRQRVPIGNPRLLALWKHCRQRAGVTEEMELIETPDVDSPALFGCFRLRLLLPEKMDDSFSPAELRHIFLHELSHVRRRDPAVNWLMALAQIIHWFNPLVWFAFSRMRAHREEACDARALSWIEERETQSYGATVLKLMQSYVPPAAAPALVGILEDKRHMKRRIQMIAAFRRTSPRWAWGAALLLALGIIGLTDAYSARVNRKTGPDWEAIVDTNTTLRFAVAGKIADANDAFAREAELDLSPDGRFLLAGVDVLPLNGGPSFSLVHTPGANRGAWSPEGDKVAYYAQGVWVVPVSTRTARPTGPAQRLYADEISWFRGKIWWSRDSQQLLFVRWDRNMHRKIGAISIADGKLQAAPDYAAFGLRSPAGEIAYSLPQQGVWVRPDLGGAGAKLSPTFGGLYCDPLLWLPFGRRLITVSQASGWYTDEFRFIQLPGGEERRLERPDKVGSFTGVSCDGKELLFYASPFRAQTFCQTVAVGGQTNPRLDHAVHIAVNELIWLKAGNMLALEGDGDDGRGDWGYWLLPVSGGEPKLLKIETPPELQAYPMVLSPDGQKLLLTARSEQPKAFDLYVISVALAQAHTVGEARKVFSAWRHPHRSVDVQFSWSPDCTKVAIEHLQGQQADLWLVSADLPQPIRLTDTLAAERHPKWSPDGSWIAFTAYSDESELLQAVPSRGGTVKTMRAAPSGNDFIYTWAPDSKALNLVEGGAILALPLDGGSPRAFCALNKHGLTAPSWIEWSPDGTKLGIYDAPATCQGRLYALTGGAQKPIPLGPVDRSWKGCFAWSPDSSSIGYVSWRYVKTAPQGTLYALNAQNAFETLFGSSLAGATMSDAALNAGTATHAPQLSDNFDTGDLSNWTVLPSRNPEVTPKHGVVDGTLMLQDTQVEIGNVEWTNYLARVRVCFTKNLGDRACAQLQVRRTGQTNRISNYSFLAATNLCLLSFRESGNTNLDSQSLDYYLTTLDLNTWYELRFEARGSQLKGYLDGRCVVVANDPNLTHGRILLGAFQAEARFDEFSVTRLP